MAEQKECRNCGGEGWVCESHLDLPWNGTSTSPLACACGGAGAPCPVCSTDMACAGRVEPWRELALKAIELVADAERETSWGSPTFGPTPSEELRAEAAALSPTPGDPA